jgi:hypothetical protein
MAMIQWVVQDNLGGEGFDALAAACRSQGLAFVPVAAIPFSPTLPDFRRDRPSILYGSTTLCSLAYAEAELRPGVFFDPAAFTIENYNEQWGGRMLNSEAEVYTIAAMLEKDWMDHVEPDKVFFVRPNDDSKLFAGQTRPVWEIRPWLEQMIANGAAQPDAQIAVGEPYSLYKEWRLWIVKGQIVAASQYRTEGRLFKRQGVPYYIARFANECCEQYMPHDVFVMDVCVTGGEPYIVECNCMNSSGFYSANVEDIVRAVSRYFRRLL